MNRRQFVVSLFGAVAAVPVLARLEPFIRPEELSFSSAEPAVWLPVFNVTLAEFRRLFDEGYRDYVGMPYGHDATGERRLGDTVRSEQGDALTVKHHLNVAFDDFSGNSDRYISPAAGALAIGAAQCGIGVFSTLPLPHGVLFAGNLGPVRMVCMDDKGMLLTRFDVAGAETPDVLAIHRRMAQNRLKATIKERLRITYGARAVTNASA